MERSVIAMALRFSIGVRIVLQFLVRGSDFEQIQKTRYSWNATMGIQPGGRID